MQHMANAMDTGVLWNLDYRAASRIPFSPDLKSTLALPFNRTAVGFDFFSVGQEQQHVGV